MKQIYGIDLSQKKFDVNFLGQNGKIRTLIVKNNLNQIVKFLEQVSKDAILVAEHTGVYGELLVYLSHCMNIPIALVSGYEIKHSLGLLKGKSDKIDAFRIREYGERFYDKLKLVLFEDEVMKELKELYSLRSQLVKERKMLTTQDKGRVCQPFNSLKAHEISFELLQSLNKAIKNVEMEIDKLICSNEALLSNYKIVKSVKGIGQVTSCELIIKTGNFKEINTARKAASYAGVCPFPDSSGKMVKKSRVSSMADKELKSLLYLCAVSAVNSNPEYKLYFQHKKSQGKPYYLIMNNISNKLLRTIFSLISTRQEYILGHVTSDPRENKKVA